MMEITEFRLVAMARRPGRRNGPEFPASRGRTGRNAAPGTGDTVHKQKPAAGCMVMPGDRHVPPAGGKPH
ncbi:hypothetical protein C9427_04395 [Mesorhizobium helmanticense]|uniref:Uncharacterized protein n=1 Tax=Mesorhizobium helmanticense TaxID=1776423 RepID=A0A2T4J0P7_9HYPH|nr:hypothetical protein C9427_04395 [Mesorhizobium helmanticense]